MPKQPTPFEDNYPFITRWIDSYGWIEIGRDDYNSSFIRALDEGGIIWESAKKYSSLDAALRDLEIELMKAINEIG
jgi:hypothetical protein